MELKNNLIGYRLDKIQKQINGIKLVFENKQTKEKIAMSFKGLLVETPNPSMNKIVVRVELRNVLGFKALSQLRHLGYPVEKYKQLLIQMDDLNEENKTELICVFDKYKITRVVSRRAIIKIILKYFKDYKNSIKFIFNS